MPDKLLHEFQANESFSQKDQSDLSSKNKKIFLVAMFGILLGVLSGFGFFSIKTKTERSISSKATTKKKVKQTAGVKNTKLFPDSAEGLLKEGGIDGEGSFHLERPGGESQNVYLTSSTIDLSQFVGEKVRVWGKTYKGEKAGWLMDVGYLEVIE